MTFLLALALVLSVPLPDAPGPGTPGPDATPQKIQPVGVRASSHMPDWKGYTFRPENLIDGRVDTSWQPAKSKGKNPTYGVGQWFEVDLGATYHVSSVEIATGLQLEDKLGDLFCRNNRIATALLLFDDGSTSSVAAIVQDTRLLEATHFYGRNEKADDVRRDGARTRFVRVLIQDVLIPVDWTDVAVAEIAVFGRPAEPLAPSTAHPVACGSAGFVPFIKATIDFCASPDASHRAEAQCGLLLDDLLSCKDVVGSTDDEFEDGEPLAGPRDPNNFIWEMFPPIEGALTSRRIDYQFRGFFGLTRTLRFERPDDGPWQLTSHVCILKDGHPCGPARSTPFFIGDYRSSLCWKKLGKTPPTTPPIH